MKHTKNNFIVACLIVFSMFTIRLNAQLAGTYTINSAVATGGNNYQTFSAFAAVINTAGISAPVTVIVAPGSGPYVEQVTFTSIAGTSATNTIAIMGNSCTLTYAATSNTSPWTLNMNSTDYVTVNDLIISGTGSTYALTCHLWNGADNNRFNNCTFNSPGSGTGSAMVPFSLSGTGTSATGSGLAGNNNIVSGCTANGGSRSVVFYCSSSTVGTGNQLLNSKVLDFYTYGVYVGYCSNTLISGNTIERVNRTNSNTGYGIYLTGYTAYPTLVEKNKIRRMFGGTPGSFNSCYGLYLATGGVMGSPNVFANNSITDINSEGYIYGIYDLGYSYNDLYHNTISLDDQNSTSGSSAYGILTYGYDQIIRNNLISVTRSGGGWNYCLNYGSTGITSNNNVLNYYSASNVGAMCYYNMDYTTLTAWQNNGNGWDGQSASGNPAFTNTVTFDYTPTTPALNNIGAPLGYATDINGTSRNMPAPDAGAYEFFNTGCSGVPPTNSVIAPSGVVCPSDQSFLSLASTYTVNGITFQWASATNSVGPFLPVSGATLASFSTPTLSSSTWYSVILGCSNGGGTVSATSAGVMVASTTIDNVPYFEGFEGSNSNVNKLPNCSWSRTNPTNCRTSTVSTWGNRQPLTGNGFANFDYGNTGTTNTYHFYSNGIQLNAGVTYSASVWYIVDGYPAYSDVSLYYGPNQSTVGLVTLASQANPANSSYKKLANTFQVATSGVYYVAISATDNYGYSYLTFDDLSVVAPCTFTNNAANISLNAPASACFGKPITMSVSGTSTFSWSTGATTTSISVTPTINSVYYVTGTNTLSGCSNQLAAPVTVNAIPGVQVYLPNSSICDGQSVTMFATGSANSFTWANGPATSSYVVTPSVTTTYTVNGSDASGCIGTYNQVITVNQLPSLSVNGATNICLGEPANLTASGATSYTWASNTVFLQSANALITPLTTGTMTYNVTGKDINNCSATTMVSLNVNACLGLNALSGSINGLRVYPNPTSGEFVVELGNGLTKSVEVMDVTGRVVVSATSSNDYVNVNINTLSNGVYYVKVKSNHATEVLKVVKQ